MPEGWRRDRTRCGRWRFHDRTERFVKADQGDDPERRAFQPFLLPDRQQDAGLPIDMLLRHASGQLYQECTPDFEQEFRQVFLPGMASDANRWAVKEGCRFTPSALARALVERALAAIGLGTAAESPQELDILDPACGSGVFCRSSSRVGCAGYSGTLTLRGFDSSPISCEISKFCLERVKRDLPASPSFNRYSENCGLASRGLGVTRLDSDVPPFVPGTDATRGPGGCEP